MYMMKLLILRRIHHHSILCLCVLIRFIIFMVGNAVIDDYHNFVGLFKYWWTHRLISDLTYHNLRITCEFVSSEHPSLECSKAIEAADKEQGDIDPYSIYTATCNKEAAGLRSRFLRVRHLWMWRAYDPCTGRYCGVYFNVLGPMLNPASVSYAVVGVCHKNLVDILTSESVVGHQQQKRHSIVVL